MFIGHLLLIGQRGDYLFICRAQHRKRNRRRDELGYGERPPYQAVGLWRQRKGVNYGEDEYCQPQQGYYKGFYGKPESLENALHGDAYAHEHVARAAYAPGEGDSAYELFSALAVLSPNRRDRGEAKASNSAVIASDTVMLIIRPYFMQSFMRALSLSP